MSHLTHIPNLPRPQPVPAATARFVQSRRRKPSQDIKP